MISKLRIAPWNSTVLGRRPNPKHDARDWSDGWISLNFQRAYKDGSPAKMTGRHKFNVFGYSHRAGSSCGEYLHVPLTGKGADGRAYRVRCRFQPGMRFRKRRVKSVRVQNAGECFWQIEV